MLPINKKRTIRKLVQYIKPKTNGNTIKRSAVKIYTAGFLMVALKSYLAIIIPVKIIANGDIQLAIPLITLVTKGTLVFNMLPNPVRAKTKPKTTQIMVGFRNGFINFSYGIR